MAAGGCHLSCLLSQKSELIEQVQCFEQRINADPLVLADRLWVTTHLNPKVEKLRVSA